MSTQATQTNQIIIPCDDNGVPTGEYIPKSAGHTGEGKRHLAITVLLYNSTGEVLLQKRRHQIFDNIWDLTGATHPLHDDSSNETHEEATLRCLKREYGINQIKLENLGSFNYFSQYENLCENEHCAVLVGLYNGEIKLNPEVGYEVKWMLYKDFFKDTENNPEIYSPWAIASVPFLKNKFTPQ